MLNFRNHITIQFILWICFFIFFLDSCSSNKQLTSQSNAVRIINVDIGWANNSVNATIFRKNSIVSFKDSQYIAFYNKDGFVVLGKRSLGDTSWLLKTTLFKGRVSDAHNVISIMVDGDGYLHMAWDHHNDPLHYAKSIYPGSLELVQQLAMTGLRENRISYPEFYRMPNGNLLFFYRDGGSGNGSLVIDQYDLTRKQWTSLQTNFIDGEGKRSPYWQACVDNKGSIHVSWVWRETPDVASNHDLCYARSSDGGKTWERSDGKKYFLPITESTAEVAWAVPQNSELINQTSMFADDAGRPYISTYWRSSRSTIPQFRLVFKTDNWQAQDLGFRSTAFSLSGAGTKRIPISRPQVIAWKSGDQLSAAMIFRDEERGNKISIAVCKNLQLAKWEVKDLSQSSVGSWEPTYDTELWKSRQQLHLFVQNVQQLDGEGKANLPPEMVQVLEWDPKSK
jgi:hypothetical protein